MIFGYELEKDERKEGAYVVYIESYDCFQLPNSMSYEGSVKSNRITIVVISGMLQSKVCIANI